MKLATFDDGSRDGQLAVVSRDLSQAHFAAGIATRLQQVLDDWNYLSPLLEDLSATLNHGKARHAFAFDPRLCRAPLPRAFQWAGPAAFGDPDEVRALAEGLPARAVPGAMTWPRRGADAFQGPCQEVCLDEGDGAIGCFGEIAVVTGDVARGATPEAALEGVRLLMLAQTWRVRPRGLPGASTAWLTQDGEAATAFAPVAVTPDELGAAWHGGRACLTLEARLNGQRIGSGLADAAMPWHFGELIAKLAQGRRVGAGSILASGPVSSVGSPRDIPSATQQGPDGPMEPEQALALGLSEGDRARLEATANDGSSLFGAIDQRVRVRGGASHVTAQGPAP